VAKAKSSTRVGSALDIQGLSFDFPDRRLFSGISLRVMSGESVAVLGPSRSGKSTLLACVLGMVRQRAGKILVDGTDMATLGRSERAVLRSREIGLVFPDLLPELSPLENVLLAGLLSGAKGDDTDLHARRLLNALEISPDTETTAELSGEDRQYVAIARALVNRPSLLLADEPAEGLGGPAGGSDQFSRDALADLLFALPAEHSCGLLVVTHDEGIARRADQVFELRAGRLTAVPRVADR
jgi:predicted ABC-type transport system involved in lysophospholipase L1 biosynthesis ATPase subunit